ncbi:MAG: DUF58 domain-containing protein, partial [Anaerolineae bacterium]|nr:DUF58 domain-containing protein [Anaerolineae bacterium]
YAMRTRRPGLIFVLSDLMDPNGYQDGLNALLGRGYEVTLIQVLAVDEVDPPLSGDLRLIDVESGEAQEVSINEEVREVYLQRLLSWREEIGAFCLKRGVHFITLDTRTPWEQLLQHELRRVGVLH